MDKQWKRKRFFVGATISEKPVYEIFSSWYNPTVETHGAKYKYVFGAYRTKKRAKQIRDYQYPGYRIAVHN